MHIVRVALGAVANRGASVVPPALVTLAGPAEADFLGRHVMKVRSNGQARSTFARARWCPGSSRGWRAPSTRSTRRGPTPCSRCSPGYKKSAFLLPEPESWEPQDVTETIALRGWALHDASPDRLLALRQVASLYGTDTAPFGHAADVQASAEVIYAGLRTDAVAEAVKGSREAHAQAQDAARQTVKNATDMVKGATERMLAALVAVGAVLIANAGRALPDDTGRLLIDFGVGRVEPCRGRVCGPSGATCPGRTAAQRTAAAGRRGVRPTAP